MRVTEFAARERGNYVAVDTALRDQNANLTQEGRLIAHLLNDIMPTALYRQEPYWIHSDDFSVHDHRGRGTICDQAAAQTFVNRTYESPQVTAMEMGICTWLLLSSKPVAGLDVAEIRRTDGVDWTDYYEPDRRAYSAVIYVLRYTADSLATNDINRRIKALLA